MGFFRGLRRRSDLEPVDTSEQSSGGPTRGRFTATAGIQGGGLVHLSGTTTVAKDACLALAVRHGIGDGGHVETDGFLQPEPNNPVDPAAVAVHVDGERIGYLPGGLALSLRLPEGGSWQVRVQVFSEQLATGLRVEAWAWLSEGLPQWRWSVTDRPPMSSQAKNQASHDERSRMVRQGLAEGGHRASSFRAGMVNGVHYLELVEPIKQLKRDGRLEEALSLCHAAIEAAEGDRGGREPAPWYTEQAAIIHRKLGQRDEEIAVLTRWMAAAPPERREGSRIATRLAKIKD